MAPKLPKRYEPQVRLGRDGDVEEWLATDSSLDRPVLVRILESAARQDRRRDFIDGYRAAAAAHHVSLAEVYSVGTIDNPYAVSEWQGGVSLADRLGAGDTLAVTDFLTSAPRLAFGLAALHSAGVVHGAIDTGAIGYAGQKPAKLGAFGRSSRYTGRAADTAALAAALRVAITGNDLPGIRPSQVVEGLPTEVDGILMEAERGRATAARLAASLRAIPPVRAPERKTTWSWRWTALYAVLVGAALLLSAIGTAIDVDPESPFLFPAVPAEIPSPAPAAANASVASLPAALAAEVLGYDPFGTTFPNSDSLALVLDGIVSTTWQTDTYFGPLVGVKPGVGVIFTVEAIPRFIEIVASPGTSYAVMWSETLPDDFENWQGLWAGTILEGPNLVRVPERAGGRWLLWLTGLPEQGTGQFFTEIAEVRFVP